MKKILFTCFLGLLCLFPNRSISKWWRDFFRINSTRSLYLTAIGGLFHRRSRSISQAEGLHISCINNHIRGVTIRFVLVLFFGIVIKVNSQVACSPPGIELVDNPGIPALAGSYRGGDACPDTFFSVTSQDIDGGPGLLPARCGGSPFVKSNKRSDNVHESTVDCRLRTVDCNTKGFSLVDNSISLGQGSLGSPAASGSDLGDAAVIWGRVSEYSERSQIQMMVYPDYFFSGGKAPRSNHLFLPLQDGNLMEGGYPKDKSFQYNLAAQGTQWFSLSLSEGNPFMELYRIDPEDSIQLFLDLESNYLVFGGKSREKFKLQQGLLEIRKEQIANMVPTLWTPDPEKVLDNPEFQEQRKAAISSAGPVLEIRSRDMDLLQELQSKDLYAISGSLASYLDYIDSYQGKVADAYLDFFKKEVELREWKNYLNELSGHLRFARRSGEKGEFLAGLLTLGREKLEQAEEALEIGLDNRSAAAMDYFAAKMKLWSAISGEEALEGLSLIRSAYWQEKFLVRHFYESYENIPLAEARLKEFLEHMQYPDFARELSTLESLKGKGSLMEGFEFIDQSGKRLNWEDVATGELILVEFWISGCKACMAFNEQTLRVLKEQYEGESRFQVITVSADFNRELWLKGLESGRYTQSEFTNLYTGAENRNHPFLLKYGISSFPNRILINREGRFIQTSQVPFLAHDLIELIDSELLNEKK